MVSVIVVTKNREENLNKCLAALYNNDLSGVEILVVDSGDRDNSAEFPRGKNLRYFHCVEDGLAKARKFGFEKARGEVVIYIDDDAEVTKNWLKNILAPFKDPKIGGVSGPTIVGKEEMKNRDVFKFNKGFVGWFYKNIILERREMEVGRICKSGMWTPGANYFKENGRGTPRPYIQPDFL